MTNRELLSLEDVAILRPINSVDPTVIPEAKLDPVTIAGEMNFVIVGVVLNSELVFILAVISSTSSICAFNIASPPENRDASTTIKGSDVGMEELKTNILST